MLCVSCFFVKKLDRENRVLRRVRGKFEALRNVDSFDCLCQDGKWECLHECRCENYKEPKCLL